MFVIQTKNQPLDISRFVAMPTFKATGLDKNPPKIVKMSANVIDSHLANIINNDITKNVFSEK